MYQEITVYHKQDNGYLRQVLIASVRSTSILNRTSTGVSTNDTGLIRIFDIDNGTDYLISKDDVVVNKSVDTEIQGTTPITTLQNLYGKDNVWKVKSVDIFRFDDEDINELNHTKVGLV